MQNPFFPKPDPAALRIAMRSANVAMLDAAHQLIGHAAELRAVGVRHNDKTHFAASDRLLAASVSLVESIAAEVSLAASCDVIAETPIRSGE